MVSRNARSAPSLPTSLPVDSVAAPSESRPLPKDDMIIVVMGPTRSGKSTFINIATRFKIAAVANGPNSCTQTISGYGCRHPDGDRNVVFVDTPGFDNTNRSYENILHSITKWLFSIYKRKIGLSGILCLHRISDRELPRTPLQNLVPFQELCSLDNVILMTTHWDQVEEPFGWHCENELMSVYWRLMTAAGSQAFRFKRTHESAWDAIRLLPPIPQSIPLLIHQRKTRSKTSAKLHWFTKRIKGFRQAIVSIQRPFRSSPNDTTGPPVLIQQDAVVHASEERGEVRYQDTPSTLEPSQSWRTVDDNSGEDTRLPVGWSSVEGSSPVISTPPCIRMRGILPSSGIDNNHSDNYTRRSWRSLPEYAPDVSGSSLPYRHSISRRTTRSSSTSLNSQSSGSHHDLHFRQYWDGPMDLHLLRSMLRRPDFLPGSAFQIIRPEDGVGEQLQLVNQDETRALPASASTSPQEQGATVTSINTMVTEIHRWSRDIHQTISPSSSNTPWEGPGDLGTQRLFRSEGDLYIGCHFDRANVGSRNGTSTVASNHSQSSGLNDC